MTFRRRKKKLDRLKDLAKTLSNPFRFKLLNLTNLLNSSYIFWTASHYGIICYLFFPLFLNIKGYYVSTNVTARSSE